MKKLLYVLSGVLATMMVGVLALSMSAPLAMAIPAWCFTAVGLGVSVVGSLLVYKEGRK